jgi:hypothetical protein
MKKLLCALAALLLLAALLPAQGAPKVARRVLLSVVVRQGASFSETDRQIIARSMLVKLQSASAEVVLVELAGNAPSDAPEDLVGQARDAGADAVILVAVAGDWPSMKLRARSFDLLANRATLDLSVSREGYSSVSDLAHEDWSEIGGALADTYHMVAAPAVAPRDPRKALLTIKALPGTSITGLAATPLQVGPDGSASLELPDSREYQLRASLPDRDPVTQRIFLSSDQQLAIDQRPRARWALTVSLQNFGYPSFDASWFRAPDGSFLRAGLTSYAVGLALTSDEILYSAPLTHLFLDAGFYTAPADSPVRPYIAVGAFARLLLIPGTYAGVDPISPWGLRLLVGAEIPSPSRNRAFIEWTPTCYVADSALFAAALGSGKLPPGWLISQGSVTNVLSFRVGYRWFL